MVEKRPLAEGVSISYNRLVISAVIVDYGGGNLASVAKALAYSGLLPKISQNPSDIAQADLLILPGQAAIGSALSTLTSRQLVSPIKDHFFSKKPLLGICLGFQLLFESSEEDGGHLGLGLLAGTVRRFCSLSQKVPHMGWNRLHVTDKKPGLFEGIAHPLYAYFANSYYVDTPSVDSVCTTTDYGHSFVSSIQTSHVFATQFHPEKSGPAGLRLLQNFIKEVSCKNTFL